MARKVVVMVAIPAPVQRGDEVMADLSYVPFARATWEWWCRQHSVEFMFADQPFTGDVIPGAPAPIQRWQIVADLLSTCADDTRVAVIDADTMIRWDTPDPFTLAGGDLAAVHDVFDPNWIYRSITAYQKFFPGIQLAWWDYFNSGLVFLSKRHLPILHSLIRLYRENREELRRIQVSHDVGIDQTLLNFTVKQQAVPVNYLPRTYNLVGCFRLPISVRVDLETGRKSIDLEALFANGVFEFINYSYIWHFVSSFTRVLSRGVIMAEAWHRICHNYPGVVLRIADRSIDEACTTHAAG